MPLCMSDEIECGFGYAVKGLSTYRITVRETSILNSNYITCSTSLAASCMYNWGNNTQYIELLWGLNERK